MEVSQNLPEPSLSEEEDLRKPGLLVKFWRWYYPILQATPHGRETMIYTAETYIGGTLIAYAYHGSWHKAFKFGIKAAFVVMWGHQTLVGLPAAWRQMQWQKMQEEQREGKRQDIEERLGGKKDE